MRLQFWKTGEFSLQNVMEVYLMQNAVTSSLHQYHFTIKIDIKDLEDYWRLITGNWQESLFFSLSFVRSYHYSVCRAHTAAFLSRALRYLLHKILFDPTRGSPLPIFCIKVTRARGGRDIDLRFTLMIGRPTLRSKMRRDRDGKRVTRVRE